MPATLTIPALLGRATAVLGEHAKLHTLMDQLRDICTGVGVGSLGTEADRYRLLEEARERLCVHFEAEEHEGHFGMLVTTQPGLSAEIRRLKNEHKEFLRMIDRLLELGRASSEDQEFTLALKGFLERFNAHERSENTLLQEFFLRDEGDSGH